MASVSASHITLTPTQPVGSWRPQRGLDPGPSNQESRALPTELPRPPNKTAVMIGSSRTRSHLTASQAFYPLTYVAPLLQYSYLITALFDQLLLELTNIFHYHNWWVDQTCNNFDENMKLESAYVVVVKIIYHMKIGGIIFAL